MSACPQLEEAFSGTPLWKLQPWCDFKGDGKRTGLVKRLLAEAAERRVLVTWQRSGWTWGEAFSWLTAIRRGRITHIDVVVAQHHGWSLSRTKAKLVAGLDDKLRALHGFKPIAALMPGVAYDGTRGSGGVTLSAGDVGSDTHMFFDMVAPAQWISVPDQEINSGTGYVGALGFHPTQLASFTMSGEGGASAVLTEMEYNPDVGWGYWAQVNQSDWTTGYARVHGLATPATAGTERLLDPIDFRVGSFPLTNKRVYVSATGNDGTAELDNPALPYLNPYAGVTDADNATGDADGVQVIFLTGTNQNLSSSGGATNHTPNHPVTVTRQVGTTIDDVSLSSCHADGLFVEKIRFKDIKIVGRMFAGGVGGGVRGIFTGCNFVKVASDWEWLGSVNETPSNGFDSFYFDCIQAHIESKSTFTSENGFAALDANCVVDDIGEDAFSGAGAVYNSVCTNMVQVSIDGEPTHPDLYAGGSDGLVLFNVTQPDVLDGQGLYWGNTSLTPNLACVGMVLGPSSGVFVSQAENANIEGAMIWHCSMKQPYHWRATHASGASAFEMIDHRNNIFGGGVVAGENVDFTDDDRWAFDSNHYQTGSVPTIDANASSGGADEDLYVDPEALTLAGWQLQESTSVTTATSLVWGDTGQNAIDRTAPHEVGALPPDSAFADEGGGDGSMSGSTAGSATVSGTLVGAGRLSGSAAGVATASGNLQGESAPGTPVDGSLAALVVGQYGFEIW